MTFQKFYGAQLNTPQERKKRDGVEPEETVGNVTDCCCESTRPVKFLLQVYHIHRHCYYYLPHLFTMTQN